MGLAAPFARPARTLVSLAAIAFGATAVIFAFGLSASLGRAAGIQTLSATVPVQIQQQGPGGGPNQVPTATQDAAVTAALRAQPGTAHQTEVYENQIKVPGVTGSVNAWAFSDDASWIGYGVIAGHWYDAPGQVDVNTAFLNASGLAVGDTATVDTGTAQVTVHIVGEVFHPSSDPALYGSTETLPGLAVAANVDQWDVGLRPGTQRRRVRPGGERHAGLGQSVGGHHPARRRQVLQRRHRPDRPAGPDGGGRRRAGRAQHGADDDPGPGARPGDLQGARDAAGADADHGGVLGGRPGGGGRGHRGARRGVLNTATVHAMAGTAHTGIPASITQVFPPSRLALLSLAALAIAVIGALAPASWAARARPAVALRTE